jgi:hypothetical protein
VLSARRGGTRWRDGRGNLGSVLKASDKFSNRVDVRQSIQDGWVWQLVTPDGHVVQQSDSFGDDRDACEHDARRQGFPVVGLRRKRGESSAE